MLPRLLIRPGCTLAIITNGRRPDEKEEDKLLSESRAKKQRTHLRPIPILSRPDLKREPKCSCGVWNDICNLVLLTYLLEGARRVWMEKFFGG